MRALLKSAPTDSQPTVEMANAWLAAHPEVKTVAIYAALPGEIDLLSLISPAKTWVLPRVSGHDLILHQVRNRNTDLSLGAFGIREPTESLPVVAPDQIDAFFCPGLAFDASGRRLGRGKGFYDRMLENARPDSLKIGICHPFQIVPTLACEPHDIRMDHVIF